jgi:hypothetical protein
MYRHTKAGFDWFQRVSEIKCHSQGLKTSKYIGSQWNL